MDEPLSKPPAPDVTGWHTLELAETCDQLNVDIAKGLSVQDADQRLQQSGPNRLAEKPPRKPWMLFVDQFKNLLIGLLVGAAILAGMIGDIGDSVVILVVVTLNAFLGFYQEYRAEQSLAALKQMLADTSRVRRDGADIEIPSDQLVPGDVVLLEAGEKIPADGRLSIARNLEIDESPLSGESYPVAKSIVSIADAPLAERVNMAFMGTTVTRGRGEFIVTATGMLTAMGQLAEMLDSAEESETPLQIQLDGLGRRLAVIAMVIVVLILVWGLLRGEPLVQTVLTAIALAVAAIPEGLPAVVTVTLAFGMHHMAKQGAIIRRLAAVETLGCTSVICSDKTGTLTLNQMTARALIFRGQPFDVTGTGYRNNGKIVDDEDDPTDLSALLNIAALCNDSTVQDGAVIGDPMEAALLVLAEKGGVDPHTLIRQMPRSGEIPFDSEHKFMATFHEDGDLVRLFVKGAPDVLAEHCSTRLGCDWQEGLDTNAVMADMERLASDALRVLALASKDIPASDFDPEGDLFSHVDDLVFVGLVGLMDPPRPEAREAIRQCHRAGIRTKMITGDHRITASVIARELDIPGDVLTGRELDEIPDDQLVDLIADVGVFARVAPEHKLRLVTALKKRGHIVAMTGDGVNDAPAIKSADIGIAMGVTGTDVTKEAAAMILTDDSFATITGAVSRGRTIYANIVKFIRFQLSTNIGAMLCVLVSPLLGLPVPFSAIQLLWINIIMDGPPAMALALDPTGDGIMDEKPRKPGEKILTLRRFLQLLFYGTIMTVGTLWVFSIAAADGVDEHAYTLVFTTFVLFQVFNVFNARSEKGSALTRIFFKNPNLWLALGAVVALQVTMVMWAPAQAVFHTATLSGADWLLATATASSILVIEELRKLVWRVFKKTDQVATN
jgi:P-type Ca2+ transporter type 2C